MRRAPATLRGRIAVALIALAVALRVLVPTGFMPDSVGMGAGKGFAITICTGMGATPGWIDGQGVVHKGERTPAKPAEHPCAFAGLGVALASPELADADALIRTRPAVAVRIVMAATAVGRGLAALPPPATGPPATAQFV